MKPWKLSNWNGKRECVLWVTRDKYHTHWPTQSFDCSSFVICLFSAHWQIPLWCIKILGNIKASSLITIASNLTLYYSSWYAYKVDALTVEASYAERVEREALIQSSDFQTHSWNRKTVLCSIFGLLFRWIWLNCFKPRMVWHRVQLDKQCCRSDHSRSNSIPCAVEGKDSNHFFFFWQVYKWER